MVEIGTCDYCGEFCGEVGLTPVESTELPSGWVPTSAIERHRFWSAHRYECDAEISDGGRHLGPYHDARALPLERCRHCYSPTHDEGGWDSALDHAECPLCVAARRAWVELPEPPFLAGHDPPGSIDLQADDLLAGLGPDPSVAPRAVEPADRRRAEAAVAAYFRRSPMAVQWELSPRGLGRALGEALGAAGHGPAWSPPWPQPWSFWALAPVRVRRAMLEGLDPDGYDGAFDELRSRCAAVRRVLSVALRPLGIAADVGGEAGQFDLLTPIAISRRCVADDDLARPRGFLRLMNELRSSAGPAIVLDGRVVISERPLVLRLDELDRPHCQDGPAIAYADGFEVWAERGVVVPDWLVREPERLTIAAIDSQTNAEVRRVLLERFGAERLVREGHAELVHQDEKGRLWRRRVGPPVRRSGYRVLHEADEPLMMVEVRNATPEPDGSHRTYFLRVPPSMGTAREAVAWTFAMEGREYSPQQET